MMLRFSDDITGEKFGCIDRNVVEKLAKMVPSDIDADEFSRIISVRMRMGLVADEPSGSRLVHVAECGSDGLLCGLVFIEKLTSTMAQMSFARKIRNDKTRRTECLYRLRREARAFLKCLGCVKSVKEARAKFAA